MLAFDVPINVSNPARHAHAVTVLVNRERGKHGLPPLLPLRSLRRLGPPLGDHPGAHVVLRPRNFPRRSLGFPFIRSRGRHTRMVSENIAWGLGITSTPRRIVQMWMRSPPHRATILGHWRYGAVATVADAPMPGRQTSGVTVVQHFGR